jgi:hypothetical protein
VSEGELGGQCCSAETHLLGLTNDRCAAHQRPRALRRDRALRRRALPGAAGAARLRLAPAALSLRPAAGGCSGQQPRASGAARRRAPEVCARCPCTTSCCVRLAVRRLSGVRVAPGAAFSDRRRRFVHGRTTLSDTLKHVLSEHARRFARITRRIDGKSGMSSHEREVELGNYIEDVAASVLGARFVDPFLRAMTVVE